MTEPSHDIFGQLILQSGLVDQDTLDEQLAIQAKYREQGKKVPRLGELMAKNGVLTVAQVKNLLREQRNRLTDSPAEPTPDPSPAADSGASVRFQRGTKVFDNYEIKAQLGETSRCVTYKALDRITNEVVLLQVPRQRAAEDTAYSEAFQRAIRKAGTLNHPNLLRVLASGKVDRQLYYVSEFCRGASLRRLLLKNQTVSQSMALQIGLAVASALEHGHAAGVIHQEISPSSIIVSNTGEIKLAGFGKVAEPIRDLKALLMRAGDTPFYVAPEQVTGKGKQGADARTDIYSLGAALYHVIAGQPPYSGEDIESLLLQMAEHEHTPIALMVPEIGDELARVIETMLQSNPEDRYQTATEVVEALRQVEAGAGLTMPGKTDLAHAAVSAAVAGRNTGTHERIDAVSAKPTGRKTGVVEKRSAAAGEQDAETVSAAGRPSWILPAVGAGVVLLIALLAVVLTGGDDDATAPTAPKSAKGAVKKKGTTRKKKKRKKTRTSSQKPAAKKGAPVKPPVAQGREGEDDPVLARRLAAWRAHREATEQRLPLIDLYFLENYLPEDEETDE
ncbi:MAG: serine/threonine protein kinase [Planctomycetota bacterium]